MIKRKITKKDFEYSYSDRCFLIEVKEKDESTICKIIKNYAPPDSNRGVIVLENREEALVLSKMLDKIVADSFELDSVFDSS